MSSSHPAFDFYVPPMPNIVHVPEPRPPARAPITGYDVKTLRKQNDFLLTEIKDREERHFLLYRQNRELWKYTQDLITASRTNAHDMKEHVTKLYTELQHSHQIRSDLAAKLVIARDSKSLIKQIYKNIGKAQFDGADAERLSAEADRALAGAQSENELLRSTLKKKLEHLQLIEWQIDESLDREKVDEIMLVAEEFWSSNLTILRGAYNRFKRGIGSLLRQSNFKKSLVRVYHGYLKRRYFNVYKFFLEKRAFMHKCQRKRGTEIVKRTLLKWKLYAAIERHCKRKRRKMLLRATFGAWAKGLEDRKFGDWAQLVTVDFRARQAQIKAFRGWKGQSMFLGWYSPALAQQERKAVRHFKQHIIRALHRVAREERIRSQQQMNRVRNQHVYRLFDAWKHVCKAVWQRRGMLLVRFIHNSQALVVKKSVDVMRHKRACEANVAWQRFSAMRRWSQHAKHLVYLKRKVVRLSSLSIMRNRHVLKESLTHLQVASATIHRRKNCFKVSKIYFKHRMARVGFQAWRQNVRDDLANRRRYNAKIFNLAMYSWRVFASSRFEQRRSSGVAATLCLRKGKESLRQALSHLRGLALRRRVETYAVRQITRSHRQKHLTGCFSFWRGRWTSIIYLRMKESHIEAERFRVQIGLKVAELNDLDRNHAELSKLSAEQKQKVELLQKELDEKHTMIRESSAVLEAKRKEKQTMQVEWEVLKQELDLANFERQRLCDIENMLLRERDKDNEYLKSRNEEAENLVRALQSDGMVLRADAKLAGELVVEAEQLAAQSIGYEESVLQESEASAAALESLEWAKKTEVEKIGQAHLGLQENLEEMQQRLNIVLKEGFSEINKAESELRTKTSETRTANSSASTLEARNAELQRILDEEEKKLLVFQNKQTSRFEVREMEDIGGGTLETSLQSMHDRVQGLVSRMGTQ